MPLVVGSLWVIGAYFNIVKSLEERIGGVRRLDSDVTHFKDIINHLRLVDLDTINGIFPWNKQRRIKN